MLGEMRQSLFVGSSSTDPVRFKCASNRPSGTLWQDDVALTVRGVRDEYRRVAGELRPITRRRDRVHHRRDPKLWSARSHRPAALSTHRSPSRTLARRATSLRPDRPLARRRALASRLPRSASRDRDRVGAFARVAILTLALRPHARLRPIDRSSVSSASASAGVTRRTNERIARDDDRAPREIRFIPSFFHSFTHSFSSIRARPTPSLPFRRARSRVAWSVGRHPLPPVVTRRSEGVTARSGATL